jgi:hypothetical protein
MLIAESKQQLTADSNPSFNGKINVLPVVIPVHTYQALMLMLGFGPVQFAQIVRRIRTACFAELAVENQRQSTSEAFVQVKKQHDFGFGKQINGTSNVTSCRTKMT